MAAVRLAYGSRLHRILLYGSRARGDAEPDSDIDVLVVLNACPDFWVEQRRLGDIAYEASIGADRGPVTPACYPDSTATAQALRCKARLR